MNTEPFIYYGNDPAQFAPCDADRLLVETSIKLHPHVIQIRNKRKRARLVRNYRRRGQTMFILQGWKIYPTQPQPTNYKQ